MPIHTLSVAGGIVATLLLDTIGAYSSMGSQARYARLAWVSAAIYTAVGAVAGASDGYVTACVSAGVVGFVDATLGWRISWVIGPGRYPPALATPSRILGMICLLTVGAAGFGFTGAALIQHLFVGST